MRAQVDLYQRGPVDQSRKVSRIGCGLWPPFDFNNSGSMAQWPAFLVEQKTEKAKT